MVGRNAALLLLLVAAVISGCISSNQQDNGPPYGPSNWTGASRNLTAEERQQMEVLRTQACAGKAEGAACEMQGPTGTQQAQDQQGRAMNGTCRTMNGGLACEFAVGNRTRGAPDGNWTAGPQRMRPTPAA